MLKNFKKKTLLFIFLISLFMSTGVIVLFILNQPKFLIQQIDSNTGKDRIHILEDLDGDGTIETIVISQSNFTPESKISFFDNNKQIIREWNIQERIKKENFLVGDYDHDLHKELYIFTKRNDSLFIYSFDSRINQYNRTLFCRINHLNSYQDIIPLLICPKFTDLNGDGFDDLIFGMLAFEEASVNGIYYYSIHDKKILNRTPEWLIKPARFFFFKSDTLHEEKILVSSGNSFGEYLPDIKFPANSSWIHFLNSNLKLTSPSIEFEGSRSKFKVDYITIEGEKFLLALQLSTLESGKYPSLFIIDPDGEILHQKELKSKNYAPELFVNHGDSINSTIILRKINEPTIFETYDNNLQLVSQSTVDRDTDVSILNSFHLESFGKPLLFLLGKSKTLLSDINFNILGEIPLTKAYKYYSLSGYNTDGEYYLGISGWFNFDLIKVKLIKYQLSYLFLFPLIFIMFFLFQVVSHLIYWKIKSYKSIRDSAVNKSSRAVFTISHNDEIMFYNENLPQFLNITNGHIKNYKIYFQDHPPILKFISSIKYSHVKDSRKLIYFYGNSLFRGQISGFPIQSNVILPMVYYFEIENFAMSINSDRLKIWSDSVRKMIHDIKTPLATIGLNIQTLRVKINQKTAGMEYLYENNFQIIEQELKRMREIAQNFLTFTNLDSPEFVKLPISPFIEEIFKRHQNLSSGNIKFIYRNKINNQIEVTVDRRLLEMVINILIENAVQAVEKNGTIELRIEKVDKKNELKISVSDNGIGMPADILKRCREPFFTTKDGGNGLGLTMADRIVSDHGSHLDILSQEGEGTTFTFTLKLEQ